jgi:hypothetical protein
LGLFGSVSFVKAEKNLGSVLSFGADHEECPALDLKRTLLLPASAVVEFFAVCLGAKLAPKPAESAFINDFVKPGLLRKQPVRLALQLDPCSLDLAFRTLEEDKGADPVDLSLEGTIGLLGGVHSSKRAFSRRERKFPPYRGTSGLVVREAL